MAVKNEKKYDPMHVETLLISDIEIDRTWNGRVSLPVENEAEGTEGFKNLVTLIGREGQKTPVVVRVNPNFGKEKNAKQFQLASGFGRCEAISAIASGSDEINKLLTEGDEGLSQAAVLLKRSDAPTVKAFVRQMNDLEMREENAGENAQRSQLSTADKAFIVADILRLNPRATVQRISDIVNLNRTINKLKAVKLPAGWRYKDSKPIGVLDAWRIIPQPPGQGKMLDIAEMEGDDKAKVLAFLSAAKITKEGATPEVPVTSGRGPGQWVIKAKVKIEAMALVIATLAKQGAISLEEGEGVFIPENVHMLLKPVYDELPKVKASKGVTLEQAEAKRKEQLEQLAADGEKALDAALKGKGKGKKAA